jgi:CBS domain containing-hemolysin-like protein
MNPAEQNYGLRLMLMALMILINALFASVETALVSVRPSRLRQLASEGRAGAQAALALLGNPERLLSASQVGLTLASLGLGWLGEETFKGLLMGILAPVLGSAAKGLATAISLAAAFLLMTFAHVVFGEVVPKNLALGRADRFSSVLAPGLLVFMRVTRPFVWVIERAAVAVSRLFGVAAGSLHGHSLEEIKLIVRSAAGAGQMSEPERDAIVRLIDLEDCNAREAMVPRNQLVMVPVDADIDDVLETVSESRYSRLPVFDGSRDNIIGIVHVKDVLEFWTARRRSNARRQAVARFELEHILRKAPVVPESRPLSLALEDLRAHNAHIAFVVDEFGNISGILSLEDIFEQVFGEIEDEFDQTVRRASVTPDTFDLEGATTIRDLAMQYGIELPSGDEFETVAGFLLFRLGHIPAPGDSVEHGGRRYTVAEMDFNRIARVKVSRAG